MLQDVVDVTEALAARAEAVLGAERRRLRRRCPQLSEEALREVDAALHAAAKRALLDPVRLLLERDPAAASTLADLLDLD